LGTLALNANYNVSFTSDNFEITTKPITVIADANQTKVYGETDPTLTYTTNVTLISGDSFSGALSRVAGENVGPYAIQLGTLALNANYDVSFTSDNFEITKATPVLTWNTPADIYIGVALTDLQLNATANINGTFSYSPDFGTMLTVGNNQELTVDFIPTDVQNYLNAQKSVFINVIDNVGVSEISNSKISIYPNPTKGKVSIDFGGNVSNVKIAIVNSIGQVVAEIKLQDAVNYSYDFGNYPKGIYEIVISLQSKTITKRVVVN